MRVKVVGMGVITVTVSEQVIVSVTTVVFGGKVTTVVTASGVLSTVVVKVVTG